MASLNDIEELLNKTLTPERFTDYVPNGVQIRGREEVRRVVTGVSACLALFEQALAVDADLVLVHHGMFWKNESRVVEGSLKARLKLLLENDLSLMGYHLPLDAHPELGNNTQILTGLGLAPGAPFGSYGGIPLSTLGSFAEARPFAEVAEAVKALFGGEPTILPFGPERVTTVAAVSGGAPELVREAKAAGADVYLTGEATEYVYHFAKEEGIHFIAAGHHRTEILGIRALGDFLAAELEIDHRFIDVPNPI